MIDLRDTFHIGVRVGDLDAAMRDLGDALDITWAEPRQSDTQPIWTPETGTDEVRLRYTYSADGPQHVELLEGAPGTFWDGRDHAGAHHIGVWVDDVAVETERLLGLGWQLVAAFQSPEQGYGFFSYVQPPSGLIVELVDRALLPHFEAWWAAAGVRRT